MIILLAGTSGTGKSTLASLLASKMGITTVVSTDSVRHMLRSFTTEAEDPVLWASTYQVPVACPSITHCVSRTAVLAPPCLGAGACKFEHWLPCKCSVATSSQQSTRHPQARIPV